MTKSNITEYDNTAANNTDVEDVPLGENQMYPSNVNNAFREIMADLADINDGTVAMTSPSATSLSVTNNITVGGTVDGRDVATDGTKLDGIEAGATNVSALTDLSITDGTDGQVLTTNGAGTFTFSTVSASNADTLDSLDSTQFLRSDATDTTTGYFSVDNHFRVINSGVSGQGDNNTHFNYNDTGVNYVRGTITYFNSPAQFSAADPIYINDTNTKITEGNGNSVRVQTNSGYLEIGPQNTSWSHYNTDRTNGHYFNKQVRVNGNLGVYNQNTYLSSDDLYLNGVIYHYGDTNTYLQFHASDQFRVVTGGTERLEVNSNGVHGNGVANKWVRFEQIGTHSTSGSKGVSSLTDNGTGKTRVNYSGNFSSTSYCCPAAAADASSGVARRAMPADGGLIYTTYIQITVDNNGSTNSDAEYVHASFFHATGTG